MSELKSLSNGQIVPLLATDEVGDAGDVLTRVGAGAEFKPPSGGGGTAWGGITGTLSAQTDLQSSLDAKAPSSSAILHQATVELTNAQIKALPTTAVQIVAAPGANKVLVYQSGILLLNTTSGAYSNVAATAALYIGLGTTSASVASRSPVAMLTGSASYIDILAVASTAPADGGPNLSAFDQEILSGATNQALVMAAYNPDEGSGENFTGGNAANTLKISVTYYILNTLTGVFE